MTSFQMSFRLERLKNNLSKKIKHLFKEFSFILAETTAVAAIKCIERKKKALFGFFFFCIYNSMVLKCEKILRNLSIH